MRVLVGCERSGVVRRAFRALGHDAWSCDVAPADDGSSPTNESEDGRPRRRQNESRSEGDMSEQTRINEAGYETGACVVCGCEVSTAPDSANGGLGFCGDCGGVTCGQHREDSQAERCPGCAARHADQMASDRVRDAEVEAADEPEACECDNTHEAVNTVCRWCYARGRRQWADPEIDPEPTDTAGLWVELAKVRGELASTALALGRERSKLASARAEIEELRGCLESARADAACYLRDVAEYCAMGLNSSRAGHWEAALYDIAAIVRPR